jgi:TolB-like protein/Tfp pilus assembly protein PilF
MVKHGKKPIEIDLNQFKLHLNIKNILELSLHFDSPSRRFYLSVVALVVHEMRKRGRIVSIPLEEKQDTLALLNETIGGAAGSSKKENLLPRIYRKWKTALPNLEKAPLFRVLGKEKEYDDAVGKIYLFPEEKKDIWANLFEYTGSEENVRLRFSVDKLGVSLNDVCITYGQDPNPEAASAWNRFIESLKSSVEDKPRRVDKNPILSEPETVVSKQWKWRRVKSLGFQKTALLVFALLIIGFAANTIWTVFFDQPFSRKAPPQQPSIAVMPFENISGDPEQDYFVDGMTDDLITDLSKISGLFVIARNSTFAYKGKSVAVEQLSSELGVRYILEGSVRKIGRNVRINAQLIDAVTGGHLWAERYDGDLKNIFELQGEVVEKITSALSVKLTKEEKVQLAKKYTDNLEAYEYYLRGIQTIRRKSLGDIELFKKLVEAKSLFKKAIELDPSFARAYVSSALVSYYAMECDLNIASLSDSRKEATEYIAKALSVDANLPMAHSVLAGIQAWDGHYEEAVLSAENAITLDPNNADSHIMLAYILSQSGRHEEALERIKEAFHLNPKPPTDYYVYLGYIQFNNRQYTSALESFKSAGGITGFVYRYVVVACYGYLGRLEKVKSALQEVAQEDILLNLNYLEQFASRFKVEKDRKHYIEGFRKAGVPEFADGFEGDKADMLSTDEIRKLLVGKISTGYAQPADFDKEYNPQWWTHWRADGSCNTSGFWKDSCVYRIENNKFHLKYSELVDGQWTWWYIFRNPDGTAEKLNEYFMVGRFIQPFSVQ